MIIIADSGSTKCSWALCNSEGNIVVIHETAGFNPKFNTFESMIKEILKGQSL